MRTSSPAGGAILAAAAAAAAAASSAAVGIILPPVPSALAFRPAAPSSAAAARRRSGASSESEPTPSARLAPPPRSSALFSSDGSGGGGGGGGGYVRAGEEEVRVKRRDPPHPKIGDVVRFTDVDGGAADGEVLVGKIALVQPILRKPGDEEEEEEDDDDDDDDGTGRWLLEIQELEDVGGGYYADYPSRTRRGRRALRKLEEVGPVSASYVRTEGAYRVPRDARGRPVAAFERYRLVGYEGPAAVPLNEEVVRTDAERYRDLKVRLVRDAALAGLFGSALVDLFRGLDDALTYLAGAVAGVGYLFFLSVKTDTVGSSGAKLGNNVSNLRFVLPGLVLGGVAAQNLARGSVPEGGGLFGTVTTEQFACSMLGFLTYRIPLLVGQLSPVFGDSLGSMLPGSAGVAMQLAQEAKEAGSAEAGTDLIDESLAPVLLVCGPPGTGKTTLVRRLMEEDGRFVEPRYVDRIKDGATFERLERRGGFLRVDPTGRYVLTGEGILTAAETETAGDGDGDGDGEGGRPQRVVVVDADVALARGLTQLSGARIIGVWVGLDSMEKFEARLKSQIESGDMIVPEDETEESVLRARVKEIVGDIEYGVVSGIFEFTILNDDLETSLGQLKSAAEYCFK